MCTRSSISPANMFALFIVRWLVETLFVCEFSKFVSISDNICRCLFFTWPVKMFVIWMRNILSAGTVEYPYHAFLVALPAVGQTSTYYKCSNQVQRHMEGQAFRTTALLEETFSLPGLTSSEQPLHPRHGRPHGVPFFRWNIHVISVLCVNLQR